MDKNDLAKIIAATYREAAGDPHLAHFLAGFDHQGAAENHADRLALAMDNGAADDATLAAIARIGLEDFHMQRFIMHVVLNMESWGFSMVQTREINGALNGIRGSASNLPDSVDWMKDALRNDFLSIHNSDSYRRIDGPVSFGRFLETAFYLQWAFDCQLAGAQEATAIIFSRIGAHPRLDDLGYDRWVKPVRESLVLLDVMRELELINECEDFERRITDQSSFRLHRGSDMIRNRGTAKFVDWIVDLNLHGGMPERVVMSFAFLVRQNIAKAWKQVMNQYADPLRIKIDELIGKNGASDGEALEDWEYRLGLLRPAIGASRTKWIDVQDFGAEMMIAQLEVMESAVD